MRLRIAAFAALASATLSGNALALPVDPAFDTFGPLREATFGGSGIPNDAVAVTRFDLDGGGSATIGLTATPRFSAPKLTNDGAGTFEARPGVILSPTSGSRGALWNFSFFASITGGTLADLGLRLLYDLDPGENTDEGSLGVLTSGFFAVTSTSNMLVEGSQNLDFGFLQSGIPGFVEPPAGASAFDPFRAGEYSFVFESTVSGERAAINVNVVPLPSSALLLLFGLGTIGAFARRARRHG